MVSSWSLFKTWFVIGIQSFGGGTTTLTLIRRSTVEQNGWVSEDEFNRDWALCQMTPGINLIALTILVGRQISGYRGVVASLLGLLLPSAALTVALTAAYVSIRGLPPVQATLRGILPASVGLGLVTAFQMAKKPVESSWKMGWLQLLFCLLILVGSGVLLASGRISVPVILVVASLLGAAEAVVRARVSKTEGLL